MGQTIEQREAFMKGKKMTVERILFGLQHLYRVLQITDKVDLKHEMKRAAVFSAVVEGAIKREFIKTSEGLYSWTGSEPTIADADRILEIYRADKEKYESKTAVSQLHFGNNFQAAHDGAASDRHLRDKIVGDIEQMINESEIRIIEAIKNAADSNLKAMAEHFRQRSLIKNENFSDAVAEAMYKKVGEPANKKMV